MIIFLTDFVDIEKLILRRPLFFFFAFFIRRTTNQIVKRGARRADLRFNFLYKYNQLYIFSLYPNSLRRAAVVCESEKESENGLLYLRRLRLMNSSQYQSCRIGKSVEQIKLIAKFSKNFN